VCDKRKSIEKNISFYVLVFFVCSFVGWVYESVWKSIVANEFVNSGFLNGFYLPVYGFGGLLLIFALKKLVCKRIMLAKINLMPIVMFMLILVLLSALEYFTSVVMELIFHQRWWDYSNDLININGRVSLRNSSILASLGFVFVYGVYPLMKFLCSKMRTKVMRGVATLVAVVFAIDFVVVIIGYIVG